MKKSLAFFVFLSVLGGPAWGQNGEPDGDSLLTYTPPANLADLLKSTDVLDLQAGLAVPTPWLCEPNGAVEANVHSLFAAQIRDKRDLRQNFAETFEEEASKRLQTAIQETRFKAIADIAIRYRFTEAGGRAALLTAQIARDRSRPLTAALFLHGYLADREIELPADPNEDEAVALEKAKRKENAKRVAAQLAQSLDLNLHEAPTNGSFIEQWGISLGSASALDGQLAKLGLAYAFSAEEARRQFAFVPEFSVCSQLEIDSALSETFLARGTKPISSGTVSRWQKIYPAVAARLASTLLEQLKTAPPSQRVDLFKGIWSRGRLLDPKLGAEALKAITLSLPELRGEQLAYLKQFMAEHEPEALSQVPTLVNCLFAEEPSVRAAVGEMLSKIATTRPGVLTPYAQVFSKSLEDTDLGVRFSMLITLRLMGKPPENVAPLLLSLLKHKNSAAQMTVLKEIKAFKVYDDALWEELFSLALGDYELPVRQEAASVFASAADEKKNLLLPKVHAALASPDKQAAGRAALAVAIGQMGNKETAPLLIELLRDPDTSLQEDAKVALGSLGQREAATLDLLEKELSSPDPKYRDLVVKTFAHMRVIGIRRIGKAASDEDQSVRWTALNLFVFYGPEASYASEEILGALADGHYYTANLVRDAMTKIGHKAVPALRKTIFHKSNHVREFSIKRIQELGEQLSVKKDLICLSMSDENRIVRETAWQALLPLDGKDREVTQALEVAADIQGPSPYGPSLSYQLSKERRKK